eukprot:CAMPEP_0202695708 /NCGR_PEP_ID=MMETSP1385-20130828/9243_1 /ASSEMBLY_ACC=CAM_ASM_000861 /TAXON_ID=933848 /ORGANISM="Elphidium margaritaceum" /LENGTH=970 /DNA_ID=CAMNT_0049351785 /DNA_START=15 /DNA_END=2927 /DNA_ORIENTATION=-
MQWIFGDDPQTQAIVACCTRLKTSTLFEDKTSALNELENLAKEHPLEVGVKAMSTLCDEVLSKHFEEQLLVKKCIDILMLLLLPPEEPYDHNQLPRHPNTQRVYYEHNLELLLTPNTVSGDRMEVFIRLLKDEYAESIELQYNLVQILTMLLLCKHTMHKIRSELISIHGAINTLSELLNSPHEFIRNAAVILLTHLSCNDASIQKLIAFDGAFEKVLHIIDEELGIQGGMVVQDCLALMDNLLTHNESNQKYFVEIGCVQHLRPLLQPTDFGDTQQMTIVAKALEIVMAIARNCGHLSNAQKSFASLMHALLAMVAFDDYRHHQPQPQPQQTTHDVDYDLLKQKCLLLLRIVVHLNGDNVSSLLSMTAAAADNNQHMTATHPLLLLTKLCLYGSPVDVHNSHNSNALFDPILSLLSESVLRSLLFHNRSVQNRLTDALLRAQPPPSPSQAQQQPQQQQSWPIEFGNVLLQVLSVPQLSKGFGDPLKYWMMTRVLSFLVADNNDVKMLALSKPVFHGGSHPQSLLSVILNALHMTMNEHGHCDQRVQIGLLLLLATFCYECRDAIYAIFGTSDKHNRNRNNECMQCLVRMATVDDDARGNNAYSRGLATYIIALCLEFARDLNANTDGNANANANANHHGNDLQFSPFLFDVISREITLDRFRSNLEALRSTPEYQRVMTALQTCAKKLSPNAHTNTQMDDRERQKRMLIEEMFTYEFDAANDEYLAASTKNRFKVNLFDSVFVQQYEAIYAVIDKRIIKMISGRNQPVSAVDAFTTQRKQQQQNMVMKRAVAPSSSSPSSSTAAEYEHKLQSMSKHNESLSAENARLKQEIKQVQTSNKKKNDDDDDRLSAAHTELQELRKQLRAQNQLILEQKQQLTASSQSSSSSDNSDWSHKYNTLKTTYEHLNRDHEELLVFVGHLHEQFEKTQKELKAMKIQTTKTHVDIQPTDPTRTDRNSNLNPRFAPPNLM